MILSMATVKITVTLPDELVSYIKQQVAEHRYESVSAYMAKAAEQLRTVDPLELLIASMIAEGGEPGPEADAWIEEAMAKARAAQRAKPEREKDGK
jgi:Arc/MetJ-type ribon-helix-helix transcriptional regulator